MPPSDQDIPRRISFVRLGLVVLVLVGLGTLIWAIFFRTSPTNQGTVATNTPPTSQTPKTTTPKPKQTSSSQQKSGSSSSSTSSSSSPSTGSQGNSAPSTDSGQSSASSSAPSGGTPATSSSPQQLANTGPGNTLELFVGATAVAGLIHYGYTIRRRLGTKE